MNAPAFTPAPWTIIPARPYDGDDDALEGSFETFASVEGADGSPVCMFGDSSGSGCMYENEANARLIAAAPTMFAYVAARAQQGDREALQIVEAIHGRS